MRLTKKQREQVVELLRCAADWPRDQEQVNGIALTVGSLDLEGQDDVVNAAFRARGSVKTAMDDFELSEADYRDKLLEAAMRVEEGSWP